MSIIPSMWTRFLSALGFKPGAGGAQNGAKEMEDMISAIREEKTVWETDLPLPRVARGKVRDVYAVGDDRLLIVATDRLSAFDVVLPDPIPSKGKVLNQISVFWFNHLGNTAFNHLITDKVSEMELAPEVVSRFGPMLEGRSMLVRRTKPVLVECVVRGYLTGSGWKDYLKTGAICGHELSKGLKQCEKLPQPIFTPSTKAEVGHDENIDFDGAVKLVGEDIARRIRNIAIDLYEKGAEYAATKGILIADTKFEFGILKNQGREEIILIDEVLTPDSSRFWPRDGYETGHDQPSFDKQIVRNWLEASGWDKTPPGPKLPEEVIAKTSAAYRDAYRRLAGRDLA